MIPVTAVETHWIGVPFDIGAAPRPFAGMAWTEMQSLFVRVVTADGREGWGEGWGHAACAATRTAVETLVGPAVLGEDAGDPAALQRQMARMLHISGRSGPVMYALSAIDIALWDLAAQRAGLPLYRLLRQDAQLESLPAYASLLRYGDAGDVAGATERALAQGYGEVKLHEITVDAVHAAREAAPAASLTLDTNCPWTVDEAVMMARQLAPYRLDWLEEPVWPPEDRDGLARVRRDGGIPIAAGENACSAYEIRGLADAGAIDIAQPSVTKIGGVSAVRECIRLLAGSTARYVPHCAYFGPGYLASLHLAAAYAPQAGFERLFVDLEASPYHGWVTASDGCARVPQASGLGVMPDLAVLRRYRKAEVSRVTA